MVSTDLLSERIIRLSESQTLAMTKKSRELKALGHDVIALSIGEPDFNTPEFVKEAAKAAIDDNFTKYPPVAGIPELRQAIVDKLKRENNVEYNVNQIVVSAGAKQSMANVILSIVNYDEEVIIPAPYWVTYVEMVRMARGKEVILPTNIENNFKVTAKQVEKAITNRTKVLILNSPSNPTGAVYTRQELAAIVKVVAKHENLFVISDEIYEYINYTDEKQTCLAEFASIKNKVILVNGVSKGFAMTGWRIGYIAAPEWIAKACEKLQGQYTSGICGIAQKAAVAALNAGKETVTYMIEAFKRRRDLVLELAKDIPLMKTMVPDGAFYLFVDISGYFGSTDGTVTINTAKDLSMYLLNDGYVATVTGSAFGNPDCIRISYAASEEVLIEAFKRIKDSLSKLTLNHH